MSIKTGIITNLPAWAATAPYQVRSMSVKEACKAVSNAKLKYVETHKTSDVRFRSKKAVRQSCYIPKSAINKEGFFVRTLGAMKYAEELPAIEYDCRLVYEYGKWFIGRDINTIWNYKVTGIWQVNEAEEAAKFGQRPGDPKVENSYTADDIINEAGTRTAV